MPHDTIIRNFSTISPLAYSCPFAEGYAVYKARTIWSIYRPDAKYDDRLLCINAQNKGGGDIVDIDAFLIEQLASHKQESPDEEQHLPIPILLAEGDLMVFPNPASSHMVIRYKCNSDGDWILYNALGIEVRRIHLAKAGQEKSLSTSDLPPGVYSYICHFEGCESKFGKITLIK